MKKLPNITDNILCDVILKNELKFAGIKIIKQKSKYSEVNYIGYLGKGENKIQFKRAWAYWIVECKIPLKIANKIYKHKFGRYEVRVAGHGQCLSPEEWDEDLNNGYIDNYHIDTQRGLNVFTKIVKKYKLVETIKYPIKYQFNNLICKLI